MIGQIIGKIILGYFIIGFIVGIIYMNTTFKTLAIYKNEKYQLLMKFKRTKYVIQFFLVCIYAVMFPLTIKDMITGGAKK